MIKTILCDLGGVIVKVEENKTIEGLAKFSKRSKKYVKKYYLNSLKRSSFDLGKISPKRIFADFKKDLSLKLTFKQFKKTWTLSITGLNKNMEKLLHKLKKHYKLVLFSNTDEIYFYHIKNKYKVLNIFDDYILSYKVGHKKPSSFIYLYAMKKTRKLPIHLLYIDDLAVHIRAAKRFGIKAIQYRNMQKLKKDLKLLNIRV